MLRFCKQFVEACLYIGEVGLDASKFCLNIFCVNPKTCCLHDFFCKVRRELSSRKAVSSNSVDFCHDFSEEWKLSSPKIREADRGYTPTHR
jgi:hypothetical protein